MTEHVGAILRSEFLDPRGLTPYPGVRPGNRARTA